MIDFFFGLDLGQANDHTALAILERVNKAQGATAAEKKLADIKDGWLRNRFVVGSMMIADPDERPDPTPPRVTPEPSPIWHYQLRFLKRCKLGTSYPSIVENTKALMTDEALKDKAWLIVDATGVGRPVVDLLRLSDLEPIAVHVHGGDQCTFDKESKMWRVPKRELVSTAKVLLQQERLKFAKSLAEVKTLEDELLRFEVKISAAGHDSYSGWREGAHDDLVFALCLACWWAEKVAEAEGHQSIVTGQSIRVVT